jgi:Type II restriction endonuclease EcoO109I
MSILTNEILTNFIEHNIIIPFYEKRTKSLINTKLKNLLKKKNPYLFRSKNIKTGQDLVKEMLDAFLSSSEETIFGNMLEKLAVFVCQEKYAGYKPKEAEFPSIDLIFTRENQIYVVGIKSGSTWGNADSVFRMIENLQSTAKVKYSQQTVNLISGICYGKSKVTRNDVYTKYKGQAFWELISGNENFYIEVIEPLGNAIKNRDIDFNKEYTRKLNEMTAEIISEFCTDNLLDWAKIVSFNSGK